MSSLQSLADRLGPVCETPRDCRIWGRRAQNWKLPSLTCHANPVSSLGKIGTIFNDQSQLACWAISAPYLMNNQRTIAFNCLIVTCEWKIPLQRDTVSDANDLFGDHKLEMWWLTIIIFLQMGPRRIFVGLAGLFGNKEIGRQPLSGWMRGCCSDGVLSWWQLTVFLQKQVWYERQT